MADKKIMVDSSILIDYFRAADKSKTKLVGHSIKYPKIFISAITEFEVITGATTEQLAFWNQMLKGFIVLVSTARLPAVPR